MRHFSIVVAMDEVNGIGLQGRLPWHLPADLKHFKDITTKTSGPGQKNAVIMGRKTWESLPEKFRPLPGRVNVVLSSQSLKLPDGVLVFNSLDQALKGLEREKGINEVFVIGGAQVYAQAILHPECARIYATRIQAKFSCDAFFPAIPKGFKEIEQTPVSAGPALPHYFVVYAVNIC